MTQEIGLFEAKTNLSKIAKRVHDTGETVTLTNRGEPYVDIVPHGAQDKPKRSKAEVLDALEELSKGLPKSTYAEIRADIDHGRR